MATYTPTSIRALTENLPIKPVASPVTNGDAPGAFQYSSGGQATMMPPTMPTVARTPATTPAVPAQAETIAQTYAKGQAVLAGLAPAPSTTATTTPAEPTVGSTFSGVDYGPSYPTYQELYPELETEDQLYKKKLKMYQGEIDATNQIYDQMLNQERLAGQGRLGSNRAMSARGGLLGSDFGYANEQGVVAANTSAERAVQAERQAKIGSIMGTVRSSVVADLKEKREARQQGAQNYISYLAGADDRRNKNLSKAAKALLLAGIDPSTMDPAELEAIAKEGGLSAKDIALSYNELKTEQDSATAEADLKTRKTEAEIAKLEDKSFNLSEGQTRYDAQGNVIASKGKTYAPGTGSGSSLDLTGDGKRTLLGGGWTESEISSLQDGVKEYGLQEVVAKEKANGATPTQISALEKAYKAGSDEGNMFLTADYFKSLFGDDKLKEAAKEAGTVTGGDDWIPFNESGDTGTYVNQLMATVELYRQAGYTDQEILKMMQ